MHSTEATQSFDDIVAAILQIADEMRNVGNKEAACCLIDLVFVMMGSRSNVISDEPSIGEFNLPTLDVALNSPARSRILHS